MEVTRDEDGNGRQSHTGTMAKFCDRVHSVIFVVQAKDQRLTDGLYRDRLQRIRDHFRYEGTTIRVLELQHTGTTFYTSFVALPPWGRGVLPMMDQEPITNSSNK